MTATGALIARHVTDLFPTQTSRFDLAQAARRGVISPLRCVRIPPGPGVRTIAKVPLRKGEVDMEFDQEMLAELLDQLPFNLAIADLYKTRFNGVPGVVYAAGVRHALNVAAAFRELGLKAQGVSGETPKRELAEILAAYERGEIDVLVNAQLLAEGWNSPRATVCMHLAPTASRRIYQQRVGRVTRRHPGKEAGIVVDFVHPATKHDDPVVTLHSLLDRDVYRGGAIVVGPVRRGRGRRLRVERRVLPVTADENRRIEVFERELWRIAVEHLDYGEQIQWAALAGARVAPTGWRRARAMLHFDQSGELKRTFLLTSLQRNKNPQLRVPRAAGDRARRATTRRSTRPSRSSAAGRARRSARASRSLLLALAERKLGRRDQANNWIWRCAEYTRELHEEYAVQRWPETKRLLGLLVNSSGGAHARNARRLVQAARQQDRRLAAALLAAALPHTAEAGEVINGARMRMSRKPGALARELLRNLPKGEGQAAPHQEEGRRGRGRPDRGGRARGPGARRRRRGDRGSRSGPRSMTTSTSTRPSRPSSRIEDDADEVPAADADDDRRVGSSTTRTRPRPPSRAARAGGPPGRRPPPRPPSAVARSRSKEAPPRREARRAAAGARGARRPPAQGRTREDQGQARGRRRRGAARKSSRRPEPARRRRRERPRGCLRAGRLGHRRRRSPAPPGRRARRGGAARKRRRKPTRRRRGTARLRRRPRRPRSR